METLSKHTCFGGTLGYYRHDATSTKCPMRFTVFTPPKPTGAALIWLSGLTCTEENFTVKAGAYRIASELGLTIIAPDTSPRGEGVPTSKEGDLGFGAGFYIDATEAPWNTHYHMETYIAKELHALVTDRFDLNLKRIGIFGHSMGGHGALTLFFKYPKQYRSISAFAPICSPTHSPWGKKVFEHYLGPDSEAWKAHDATELLMSKGAVETPILIDQGSADPFIERLHPHLFEAACAATGQAVHLRYQEGYDHGYFFIQTFIDEHLIYHAAQLIEGFGQ